MKRLIARLILKLGRFRLVGDPPQLDSMVLIAAPHTTNWDFPLMLAMSWLSGLSPRWMGKNSLFKGPMGPVMRALGGIEVNRENPQGLIDGLVTEAAAGTRFALVIPAEGTRTKKEFWKSGFYRIAQQADLPVVPAWLDGPSRTGGIGEPIEVTGDVAADMDKIREAFSSRRGLRPENRTEPRLREEADGFELD